MKISDRAQTYIDAALAVATAATLRTILDTLPQPDASSVNRKEKDKMKTKIVDFANAGKISIASILQSLSEREIVEMCRTHQFSPTGRKQARINQILEEILQAEAPSDIKDDERTLLATLQKLGNKARRNDMLNELGQWSEDRYDYACNSLKSKGLITKRPGRGRQIQITDAEGSNTNSQIDEETNMEHVFLAALGEFGSTTNMQLQAALDWDDDTFYAIKGRLLEQDLIWVGPGRGGTLGVYEDENEVEDEEAEHSTDQRKSSGTVAQGSKAASGQERALYGPVRDFLLQSESSDLYLNAINRPYMRPQPGCLWVHITADLNKGKNNDGKWMCPDIGAILIHTSDLLPVPTLEVYSFEIKDENSLDVVGVHEAYAQGRMSHISIAIYKVSPTLDAKTLEKKLKPIKDAAANFGVGLLTVQGATDDHIRSRDNWTLHVSPTRRELSPWMVEHFIRSRMSEQVRNSIGAKLRELRTV